MNLTWRLIPDSAREGMRAQGVMLIICLVLIATHGPDHHHTARLLPATLVAVNAVACLLFWIVRLNALNGSTAPLRPRLIGYWAMGIGYVELLILGVTLTGVAIQPEAFSRSTDPLFYVLCVWAMLELIHHHVYKLVYGKHDTLAYLIRSGHWHRATTPLGGAIGVQVRKIGSRLSAPDKSDSPLNVVQKQKELTMY